MAVRYALDTAPPLALLFFRFLVAAILAAAAVARRPKSFGALRDGLVLRGAVRGVAPAGASDRAASREA